MAWLINDQNFLGFRLSVPSVSEYASLVIVPNLFFSFAFEHTLELSNKKCTEENEKCTEENEKDI